MSSSDAISMTTNADIQLTCHFMRLPTEVRQMIYRPLVIARHAIVEHNMNSKEYDYNRRSIQDGPDQEYRFETAILATSRRIHEEVRDLCRRENDFICLTSRQPSRLGFDLHDLGLQMIAKFSRARMFWNISMTLTLDPPNLKGWPGYGSWSYTDVEDPPEDGRPWNYIFCSDELPEFCRRLLSIYQDDVRLLKEAALYIDIISVVTNGQFKVIDDHPRGRARVEKILGPLRQLHSLGAAQIDGPLSGNYKGEIIRSICKHCPTAMDIVHETMVFLEQADEQASKGRLRRAILRYKAALNLIRSCFWQHQERDFIMSDGPFPGLEVYNVVNNTVVRLQARIAAVYYKNDELRMARIYTDRALAPRQSYDWRYNRIPHQIDIEPWEEIVYAEVLHVAAMISYRHGHVSEAIDSLEQAGDLTPFNEEQTTRHESWQAHADKLQARHVERSQARERQLKKRNRKVQALIDVVYNWKRKGERLFRSGRSYLAASVFQTALQKLESLDLDRIHGVDFKPAPNSLRAYSAVDTGKILAFQIEACLAAASLESRDYDEVCLETGSFLWWDDETHRLTCQDHYDCNQSLSYSCRQWVGDQTFEYLRIFYCRAMALYHLGDTVSAVWHMEEALRLDPGDNNVFEKLTMLKQTVATQALAKEAARNQRLQKLNSSQIQLQKKQARRRAKA